MKALLEGLVLGISIVAIPVIITIVAIKFDNYLNGTRYTFEHECELDQGIVVSNRKDVFCIYPKESKIRRFE